MSKAVQNRQFRLARRPQGLPQADDWQLVQQPLPEPGDGELLVGVRYISLDPAMRGWMNAGRSYIQPVEIGAVMRAGGAGTVLASRHPDFAVGDHVTGNFGVQTHAVARGREVRAVDTALAPLPAHLGVLGMPGLTAYFGLLDIGALRQGDMVVISAASGAVGQIAGQIARINGCTVIGIAGGARKCSYVVDELGFDAAIDYKNEDVAEQLKKHCPNGVGVYFDNVGGPILDAVLGRLALGARVVICGAVSQYNNIDDMYAPKNYMSLLVNRARMEGFVVFDFIGRYGEAIKRLSEWVADGSMRHREDIVTGFDSFPETLLRLFSGANFGKLMLEVEDTD